MIISASRRTDIPAYYANWFFDRLQEGYVLVRNPMNPHQVSKVILTPETVDGIVFWMKNPIPMLERLCSIDKTRCTTAGFLFHAEVSSAAFSVIFIKNPLPEIQAGDKSLREKIRRWRDPTLRRSWERR